MWLNPSVLPKGLYAFYVNQPITLTAFTPESDVEVLTPDVTLLCPVRALRQYIEISAGFRKSDALFVCHGGHRQGCALSKQRF